MHRPVSAVYSDGTDARWAAGCDSSASVGASGRPRDLNPELLACKTSALPVELGARIAGPRFERGSAERSEANLVGRAKRVQWWSAERQRSPLDVSQLGSAKLPSPASVAARIRTWVGPTPAVLSRVPLTAWVRRQHKIIRQQRASLSLGMPPPGFEPGKDLPHGPQPCPFGHSDMAAHSAERIRTGRRLAPLVS